jgi:hypothetical protein
MACQHGEEKIRWRQKCKICFWTTSAFISSKYVISDYFCYVLDCHSNIAS